jgi:hypothetical protein
LRCSPRSKATALMSENLVTIAKSNPDPTIPLLQYLRNELAFCRGQIDGHQIRRT